MTWLLFEYLTSIDDGLSFCFVEVDQFDALVIDKLHAVVNMKKKRGTANSINWRSHNKDGESWLPYPCFF